jgi:hypothetical protein
MTSSGSRLLGCGHTTSGGQGTDQAQEVEASPAGRDVRRYDTLRAVNRNWCSGPVEVLGAAAGERRRSVCSALANVPADWPILATVGPVEIFAGVRHTKHRVAYDPYTRYSRAPVRLTVSNWRKLMVPLGAWDRKRDLETDVESLPRPRRRLPGTHAYEAGGFAAILSWR